MTLPSFDKGFPVEVNHTFAFYVYCIAGYFKEFCLSFFTVCKFVMWKVRLVGRGRWDQCRATRSAVQVLRTAHQYVVLRTALLVLRSVVLQGN